MIVAKPQTQHCNKAGLLVSLTNLLVQITVPVN